MFEVSNFLALLKLSSTLPPFVNLASVVPPPLLLILTTPPPLALISAIVNAPDADIAAVFTVPVNVVTPATLTLSKFV